MMISAAKVLSCGDMVTRGGCRGVSWRADDDAVFLMPIVANEGAMRRGDIIIEDLFDMGAIRAGVEVKIRSECQRRAGLRGQTVGDRLYFPACRHD